MGRVLGGLGCLLGHLGGVLGRLKRVLARLETVLGRHGSLEAVLGALRRNMRGRAGSSKALRAYACSGFRAFRKCEKGPKMERKDDPGSSLSSYEAAGGGKGRLRRPQDAPRPSQEAPTPPRTPSRETRGVLDPQQLSYLALSG